MIKEEIFTAVEHAFAERLLLDLPKESAFFLKTLLFASRQGHLCLSLKEGSIKPDLKLLFGEIDSAEAEKELLLSAKALPKQLVASEENIAPIYCVEDFYYLQRFFKAESKVIKHWKRILETEPEIPLEIPSCNELEALLPEQKEAVNLAIRKSFLILTGGPGTGKTFTAGEIIKTFVKALPEDKRRQVQIDLAAPTGKAAANLEISLKRALGDSCSLSGKTLHSLLGIRSPQDAPKMLASDLVIVDESSMIDAEMMGLLLEAVKPGARLILIGDQNQLPPVEAGALFADLAAIHPYKAALKTCVRAELKSLVEFGQKINENDALGALEIIQREDSLNRIDPAQKDLKELLREILSYFPKEKDPEKALKLYNQFRILSPLRKGPLGVEEINRFLLVESWKKQIKVPFIAPIMITSNDPKMGLFNGEVGVLVKMGENPHAPFTSQDYALFSDGRKFLALLLPRFEYAFCLSVHKSQGSEFDHVLLVLPEGSELFGRKVVYTAATRAKKKISIYGSEEIFSKTLSFNQERFSGIRAHLAHP